MHKDDLARRGRSAASPLISRASACDECQIVREADHRIANDLALLAGFVRLKARDFARQPRALETGDILVLLEGVRAQIESIAQLHRSFARDGQNASADLGERIHSICASLAGALSDGARLIEDLSPGIRASASQVLPLTQIAAEAITNAIKHARRAGRAGAILVRCRQDNAKAILLEVIDDGPGFAGGFDPLIGGGLGLRLIRALSKQIGARIEFSSTASGLCFQLALPPGVEPPPA